MKAPPLLLGTALVFWGWQTGFEAAGLVMALALEAPRWIKARWDFSDVDLARIWTFCALLFLASTLYAFTANEGPHQFRSFFHEPSFVTERNAGNATARTAASLFRWLPMVFFLFAVAVAYSSREGVPVETLSLLLRRRWKRARKRGQAAGPGGTVNVSYYYFGLCLFSASVHASEDTTYFWGVCALLGWVLWLHRGQRFRFAVWLVCLGVAVALGYMGQRGIGHLQTVLGNLNPWWLGNLTHRRFDPTQNRTDLGQIGRAKISGKIIIRLEATEGSPPPLLREASYRRFSGQTWYADITENDFPFVREEPPNSRNYPLLPGKTNTLRANIGCYLEGGKALLPLPHGTARLENLTAFTLARSQLGTVIEEGPGLVVFDALYGAGATIDGPPDLEKDLDVPSQDLDVPPRERRAVEETVAQLSLRDSGQQEALRAINAYFLQNFSYSTWQPLGRFSRTNETPLTRFLLHTHRGHCEYFATAGVLLLRQIGIPARYAVGYAVHEGSAGKFVVRQRDAHAWCLVWDDKRNTWRDVDFTPPSWVAVESANSSLQALSDFWSRVTFELSKFRWGQTHLRQYLLWGLLPVLLILLYQIITHSRRRQRINKEKAKIDAIAWPGLDSDFYRLELALARHDLARLPSEPLSQWLQRICADPSVFELRDSLWQLLLLHYRYRFDPQGLDPDERQALRSQVAACLESIRSGPVHVG